MIIEKYKELIDKLFKNRASELEKLNNSILIAENMRDEAIIDITTAYKAADTKAYHKAQDLQRTATDSLEMFKNKINKLNTEPLISEEEYKAGIKEIKKELAVINEEYKEELFDLILQISNIAKEVEKILKEGNEVLRTWQHDIYKNDACMLVTSGNRIHIDGLEEKYNDYFIPQYFKYMTAWPEITKIIKERSEE